MQKWLNHPRSILLVFILLATAMRFFSFFPSVINHDESTYIVIADAILHGQVYWRDVIDTKPIGIFLLFAFFQTVFGKSIIIIRLLAALWVAITAWVLFLVHKELILRHSNREDIAGPIASGVIYIFLTSVYTFYGVSPNTELFLCLFIVVALYILLKQNKLSYIFFAGCSLGAGFIIKYVAIADAAAIGLFYLWYQIMNGVKHTSWLSRMAVLAAGFLLPFALCWLYYFRLDMTEEFFFYSFVVSGRYLVDMHPFDAIKYMLDFFLRYFPVTFWFFYCTWKRACTGNQMLTLTWVWSILIFIVVLLPGKSFGHYLIQFMLPFSLLAGSFFNMCRKLPPALSWMRNPKIGYPLLVLCVGINMAFQKMDYFDKRDYPLEIAEWIKPRLSTDKDIYTGNYHHIIYYLTGTRSPTPYVHRTIIWDESLNVALNIDPLHEWTKIIEQKPRFILFENEPDSEHPFYTLIRSQYHHTHTFDNEVRVYELN